MHRTAILALAFVLAAPLADAFQAEGDFAVPAQVAGLTKLTGATWAFLIFDTTNATASMAWQAATVTNTTRTVQASVLVPGVVNVTGNPSPQTDEEWPMGRAAFDASFQTRGLSHLIVEADAITTVGRWEGELQSAIEPDMARSIGTGPYDDYIDRSIDAQAAYARAVRPEWLHLRATGVHYLQWSNAETRCPSNQPCPPGGGSTDMGPPGMERSIRQVQIEQVATAEGTLELVGSAARVAIGSSMLTLNVTGHVRLPLAHWNAGCGECQDGTLTTNQTFLLADIHPAGPYRLAASMREAGTVYLDESPMRLGSDSNVVVVGAVVGAGLSALVIGWKLILAGATAHSDPLQNERRRRILAYIEEHPGASFREIARQLEIFQGSLSRHLLILRRSDIVVERRHGNTRRFFENHGKFDETWPRVAVLRDPLNQQLLEVVSRLEPCQPSAAIAEMEARRWSRTTAQRRLENLVAAGILAKRGAGRTVAYSVLRNPAQREAGPETSMASSSRAPPA